MKTRRQILRLARLKEAGKDVKIENLTYSGSKGDRLSYVSVSSSNATFNVIGESGVNHIFEATLSGCGDASVITLSPGTAELFGQPVLDLIRNYISEKKPTFDDTFSEILNDIGIKNAPVKEKLRV